MTRLALGGWCKAVKAARWALLPTAASAWRCRSDVKAYSPSPELLRLRNARRDIIFVISGSNIFRLFIVADEVARRNHGTRGTGDVTRSGSMVRRLTAAATVAGSAVHASVIPWL